MTATSNNKPAILSRKLSIGVINNVKNGFKGVTERQLVGRIYGIANKVEVGEHATNGAFNKFKGEFRAYNSEGQEYISPVCFLPSPADGMLAAAIAAAGADANAGVKFGFDFFVVPDEKVAIGYVYETIPLLETRPTDPFAELMGEIGDKPLQLSAPKQPQLPGVDDSKDEDSKTENAPKKGGAKK